jgi:hypothetical protein
MLTQGRIAGNINIKPDDRSVIEVTVEQIYLCYVLSHAQLLRTDIGCVESLSASLP